MEWFWHLVHTLITLTCCTMAAVSAKRTERGLAVSRSFCIVNGVLGIFSLIGGLINGFPFTYAGFLNGSLAIASMALGCTCFYKALNLPSPEYLHLRQLEYALRQAQKELNKIPTYHSTERSEGNRVITKLEAEIGNKERELSQASVRKMKRQYEQVIGSADTPHEVAPSGPADSLPTAPKEEAPQEGESGMGFW